MLKKTFAAAAAVAAAATGATVAGAAPAVASDTIGGDYSQNVSVLPHTCVDIDRITLGLLAVPIDVLNDNDAVQCDEVSTGGVKYQEDKGPLSDVIDAGSGNH